jgi:hypothetical protein
MRYPCWGVITYLRFGLGSFCASITAGPASYTLFPGQSGRQHQAVSSFRLGNSPALAS